MDKRNDGTTRDKYALEFKVEAVRLDCQTQTPMACHTGLRRASRQLSPHSCSQQLFIGLARPGFV